jgi:hypothetical protein
MSGKDWSVRRKIANLTRANPRRAIRSRPNYDHPRRRPMKSLHHRENRPKILQTNPMRILLTSLRHRHVALVKLGVGITRTARPIELLGSVGRGAA